MSGLLVPQSGAVARLMTEDEKTNYHDRDDISQSGLKLSLKNPNRYWRQYVRRPREPRPAATASMQFGKDLEEFVFENRVPQDAVLIPNDVLSATGRKAGNNYSSWLEDNGYSKEKHLLLKEEEYEQHVMPLVKARENMRNHPRVKKLLFDTANERKVGIFGVDDKTGLGLRGELDTFSSLGVILDVKSTKEPRLSGFEKEIWNFGYHIQGFFYKWLVYQLTGKDYPFVFIVVGNNSDHYVETYSLDDSWCDLARPIVRRGLDRLANMYQTGKWQTRTWGEIHEAKPKPWMTRSVWEDET